MKGNMSRREFSKRLGMVLGGLVVAIAGIPLLVLPGSGLALIFLGAGLVGEGVGLDMRALLRKAAAKLLRSAKPGVQSRSSLDGWGSRRADRSDA